MKQSTFSAVMANSIKNLLQGYTKGIRFTAILTLLFTIGVGQVWAETETLSCSAGTISNNKMTFSTTNFTFVHAKGDGSNFASYSPWRVYAKNTVTITAGSGVASIDKIEIVHNSTYYSTITSSSGTVTMATTSGGTTTINSTSGKTVTLTVTGSSQSRWSSIKVTYTPAVTKVTVSTGSVSNGSISLNKNSVTTTSAAQSVTVACTPNTGYYTKSVSATKPATGNTPTYGGSGNSRTVTYSKGSNGSSTITATFAPAWQLRGSFNEWGTTHPLTSFSGSVATVTVDLQAMTAYTFKFVDVSGSEGQWYGNSGAIITDINGWTYSTSDNGNTRLFTGPAGTYTFKFNISTKALQVIYPTVTHPAEGYAYFQKQDSWNGFKVYNFTDDYNRLSDWPGSPTVTNTTTICGKTYYYTALATQFEKVIFRDNSSNQWKEIDVSGYSGKYCGDDYNATPQTWKTFNKYSITFNSNGGSGSMTALSGICPGESQILTANSFARTGYTFNGWNTKADGTGTNYADKATIANINSNITLYAKWKANTYTITSNLTNCSSSPAIPNSYTYTGSAANLTYTITAASGYRLPDAITVSGCAYTWDKTTGQLKLTGTISGNVTITIEAVKVYTITWKVNKQTYTTGSPTQSIDAGKTYKNLTLPTAPADNTLNECYERKKFVGWSTTNIGSTESSKPAILFKTAAEAPSTTITENITLYAVFATENGGGTSTVSVFSEDFSTITGGNSTSTSGSSSTWTKNSNFYSVSSAYQAGGAVRLGKSDAAGNLVTKQLTAAIGETLTISFKVKGWSSVEGQIQVSGNNSEFTQPSAISYSSTMSGSFETKSVSVVLTKANPYIKIATTAKRAFIDDVQITKTTTSAPTYSHYVTECCTLNNITLDGSGTVTGGTFSASVTKACKGEDITLTATPENNCYEFVSWTIKKTSDGSDVTSSVLSGSTLTMPDYAVTVYATFKSLSVTGITLSMTGGEHKNLDVGETNQLLVAYTPKDATCDNAIDSWTSSNDNILSVSNTGLVTAQMAGTATITAKTAGGVTATYTITVNNPACASWYIHYWNNSTSGDECFYKVKPDDPNDHEWRTNNFSLPSFSDEDKFIVNNTPEDPYKADQIFRTGIGFADIQRGGQNCGTNPYPGQDAYGQLSIYDDSETSNRYIAFYPAQYLVTYGKDGAAPWEVLPLNNTTGYEYETEPFMVPNGYKTDDTYRYYVGITDKNGNIKYVGYEFGGEEYKKSSVDPMNTVNGLSANDMAGKWGTWHIYSNSCANNWYCEFIHYYRVEFNLNGGEGGDFAPRYGKATEPYVTFTTTDIGAPTRTGYTFLGWKDQNNKIYAPTDPTVTINEDLTLTALWIEEYGSDNCRWEEVTIDDIEYGDEVVIAMEKNGSTYALADNNTAAKEAPLATEISINANKTINTDITTIPTSLIWNIDYDKEDTKNLVIYSTMNVGKWLYSIKANDGVRIGDNTNKEFKIVEGTGDDAGNFFLYHIAQERYLGVYYPTPDWRGYTSINSYITGQTLKFYKKVCLPEGQYRVTWDANGGAWSDGSTTKEEIYSVGATIDNPDKPERDGYIFDSWEPTPSTMPAENITFTAKWAEFCTVTYTVGNGDTAPGEMQAVENTNITLPSLTTNLTCVKFVGWTDAVNDAAITSSNLYEAGDSYKVTQDITLKAVYAAGGGFVLVTDANDLAAGNRIVIAAAEYNVAMGAQNSNNRAEVDVEKDDTDNTITTPDGIQVLILEEGTITGTYAFNTGSGYLYAASSSSNHLKTQATNDANGSWTIEISAEGVATIKAQGSNTRNWLRYNAAANNGQLFSCYASGQKDVSIYKEVVAGYTTDPACVTYEVTTCTPEHGTISVDPTTVDPYGSATVTFAPADGYMLQAVTVTSGTATVGAPSYTTSQISDGTVTISNIQSDIEVCATFVEIPYYKVTFVDMNNGNAETVVHQSEFGGDITAPATASAGCNNVTWTFIGWAPSNSLNGTTEVPENLVEAGGTISGANITNNNLIYYSVYSNSSDGTPPFSIGKSGTYYFKAITENSDVYYATGEMYSNKYRSNQETKIPFYVYYNTTTKKYTIKNTLTDKYVTPTYDNGWANALQEQANSFEWNILSYSNGDFTLYEETGSINSGAKTGEYLFTYVNKSGNTRAIYFGGTYFESSGLTYSDYALYLEPASEMHYYNASSCTELVTMSFDVPADAELTYADGYPEGYYKYSEKKTITTFPTLEYAGWTFIGWTAGTPYIGEDYLNDENSSADAPTQTIYKTGVEYPLTSDVTMYPVFTKFEDNEPFDMVNGGDYYIYYIADGDVATSEDEYGASNRIYAGGWGSGGTSDSYGATQSCASATLFTFTKLSNGKWSIYDNTKGRYLCAGATDNNLALNTTTATYGEWTITVHNGNQVNAVSKEGYTLSVQSQDANSGTFKNYATSNFNNNSAYYHRVYVGTCTERVYSSNPSNKPKITLNGTAAVTSTKEQSIRSAKSLTISAVKLAANGKITLTSDNADVYFSTDKTANFSKQTKPVASLTIYADANGKLALTTVYVHYKPTEESNLGIQTVTITATTGTEGQPDYATASTIATVRNLPAKFVIATKVGANWYALPANMSSATNPEGVLIEVDETTMTATAPNTTSYTLFPVKTTNSSGDRYEEYGDCVRFSAVNNESKGLWTSSTESTIRNYAVIDEVTDGSSDDSYEWKITTTVVDGNWQYTLQTDQEKNQKYLRYWTGATGSPKWGTYAAGNNQLYFLPVTETEPFDYKVVEWYPTKMLIQTDATIANPTAKIGDVPINYVTCTNKGSKLYEIAGLPLANNPTKVLTIKFSNYTNATVIPVIISQSATTVSSAPFTTLTKDVYNYADLVVRDGATLTIDGGTHAENTFFNVTIYPTSKISVPDGKKLTVHSLTFFGGIDEIYNGSTYDLYKYGVPELSLKGTLYKSIAKMDYVMRVDLDQMYSLTVPYDVQLADIKYWDGSDIALGSALYVSAYDGEARANQNKKTWIYETDFNPATLKAGVGYTISAELQAGVGNEYSILRMPMMSNVANDDTEAAKTVAVTAWGKDANVTENHKGWNLVGNPYMASVTGADDNHLVLGYLKETGTGPWEWVDDGIRYVTIPSDDGTYYWQQKFTDAVLPPFKNFFVQVGTTGKLVFDLGTRQSMPARSTQAAIEKEVEFEILMSNDARQDNTGLLISEEYSPAYEINADLEKMTGTMSVYTIYGGYKLAYNALSPINASEWIPMGYIAPAAGEYTFRLDDVEKIVEQVEHVYVIDYDANNIVDLMTDEYKFTTNKEQNDNRFAINVVLIQDKDNTTTGLDIINGNNTIPFKFIYQDKIYIQSGGLIYDGTGKQVTNINK